MRSTLAWLAVAAGLALMGLSYFVFAAPWGSDGPANSNPRVPFAAGLFVAGVLVAFLAAVLYEVVPDRHRK